MSNKIDPKIHMGFTNIKGETFNNVKEIAYKNGELCGNLGKFVAETKYDSNNLFNFRNEELGVYIFQTISNPNIAYRIYQRFNEYEFNGYHDDKLIQNLQLRKNNVNLSKFPTGVVTVDGRIIGQEIPYFISSTTILDLSQNSKKVLNPIELYKKILIILKELHDNGIMYLDIHPKNFIVDVNNNIQLVDFDSSYIKFDDYSEEIKNRLFTNYKFMLETLNHNFEIDFILGKLLQPNNFDDSFEQLENMEKKLRLH